MLSDAQREFLGRQLRTMQIIVFALAAGVLTFLVVAVAIGEAQQGGDALVAYIAAGLAVVIAVVWAVVPNVIAARLRQAIAAGTWAQGQAAMMEIPENVGDAGRLGLVYQMRLLVACALLEGAAFFNIVAYLIDGQMLSLAVSVLLLVMLLSHFPTQGRLENWVDGQMELVGQMRTLSR